MLNLLNEKLIISKEINFVKPIIGFENSKTYIFDEYKKDSPFYLMKSVEEKSLNFIVINIKDFFIDYVLKLTEEDKDIIDFSDGSLLYFGIVTIPDNIRDMTVNLLAPVVINHKRKIGGQFVNILETYSLRERLVKK